MSSLMKRVGMILTLSLLVASVMAPPAVAANPHFKQGGTPQCRDTGTLLECKGALAGLGNDDVTFILEADGLGTFACVNPSTRNEPQGQNKVPFEVGSETTIEAEDLKNGSLAFNVKAPVTPPTATPQQAGCPGGNWSTRLKDLEFSNVSLEIQQPTGTTIFTCSRSGTVPSSFVTLSCTPA
jgi:hypothetical protein